MLAFENVNVKAFHLDDILKRNVFVRLELFVVPLVLEPD